MVKRPPPDKRATERRRMVDNQLVARGITDSRVLAAMLKVPRHIFVDEALQGSAYSDYALPIGSNQSISQPYIVALMTEALSLTGSEKVLEIGSGSGYQTAILAELARRVCSIERVKHLAGLAQRHMDRLGYQNVVIRVMDGTYGWREESPFDAIVITAGAPSLPSLLPDQLNIGGRLVIPIGDRISQVLQRFVKRQTGMANTELGPCKFVPLIGAHGWK